jgi:hypothetical protein
MVRLNIFLPFFRKRKKTESPRPSARGFLGSVPVRSRNRSQRLHSPCAEGNWGDLA